MNQARHVVKILSWTRDLTTIIGTTILLLVLGHYMIGLGNYIRNTVRAKGSWVGDPRENLPVYDNFPNKREFWKEHAETWTTRFEPYYHWRRNGFVGKYTNIAPDGTRRTIKNHSGGGERKKIFMFGGSTLWGTGVPDGETIPSIVQSNLGSEFDVYNYGETGWVSTQELNFLLYQLSIKNVPDTVIFYDGVNDGYAGAYSPAVPRDPQNLRMEKNAKKTKSTELKILFEVFEHSNYKWLFDRIQAKLEGSRKPFGEWDKDVKSTIEANADGVIDMYEAHIRQVKALGKEYGFKAFFFWQPNLFSGTRKGSPYENKIIDRASPIWVESQRQVYLRAKKRLSTRESENIFFVGDIFNQVPGPLYIDWCHVSPSGNKIIANQICESIRSLL